MERVKFDESGTNLWRKVSEKQKTYLKFRSTSLRNIDVQNPQKLLAIQQNSSRIQTTTYKDHTS